MPRRARRSRKPSKVPSRKTRSLDDLNKNSKFRKPRPGFSQKDNSTPWRPLMELQLPIDSQWLHELYTPNDLTDLTKKPGCLTLAYNVSIEKDDGVPAETPPVAGSTDAISDDAMSDGDGSEEPDDDYYDEDEQNPYSASHEAIYAEISKSEPVVSMNKHTGKSDSSIKPKSKRLKLKKVFRLNSKIARAFRKTRRSAHLTAGELRKYNSIFSRIKRLICCKNSNLLGDGNPGPRTPNPVSHVQVIRDRLAAKRIPQGRADARITNILAFDRILEALRHLTYIQDSCNFARSIMAYDKVYLERDLNSEEKELTKGKSIVGGYVWMSTYLSGLISKNKKNADAENQIKSIVKLRVEDVAGSSILLWAAMVHEVETIRSCLHMFENAIIKFIFSLKAPEEERKETEAASQADANPDKLHRVRRKKWKMKHDAEVKAKYADMYIWRGKKNVSRPEAKVFTRAEKGPWKGLKDQKELVTMIILTSSKVLQIIEDELTQLSNLDKLTQGVVPPLNEIENPSNFLEATLLMERVLSGLHQFPNNLLKQVEVDDLKEVGRIALDRLDLVYGILEEMQAMTFEACHTIHICYEYTRVYYKWPLTEFDDFGDANHKKYLALWAHSPEFKVAMPPDSLINPIPFFHGSSYPDILKSIFVSVDQKDLCLGEMKEKQPGAAFRARDLHFKESKAPTVQKRNSTPSISLSASVNWKE